MLGGAPGRNVRVDHYPGGEVTVVVLTNADPPYADRIADFIAERLTP